MAAAATQTNMATGREPENNREDESGASCHLLHRVCRGEGGWGGGRGLFWQKQTNKKKKNAAKKRSGAILNAAGFRTLRAQLLKIDCVNMDVT